MTDKELRKLSRSDLMQMILSLSRENQSLHRRLDAAEAALESREIQIIEAGSIAEAALKLNGVFEAADAACKQYLENVQRLSREKERAYEEEKNS